ncbi:uncharacterized protein PHALS_14325 [Plasmopara halstedii]|uniref:Uncharacterized protein n=1 Tax=Plasmopara halstedii TaxID=4781 RepID=A0A0P1ARI3_PLAHL|nr:uncharacterized protein PHALS_14325 [Plasmopara halstedii]CEG44055.1 hypothetical protein PHALS_14325 [Plasmopara halstedii]|eukprot:XP_024580424.1 hypothetical protein PHALS_14325 [Plasmopara halstedii]
MRQRSFGRARGITGTPVKRSRDQSSDSDEGAPHFTGLRHNRRAVLDGLKRMRVSSPSDSPRSDVDANMTDEEAATARSTWRANKAIVPAAPEAGKKRPLAFSTSIGVRHPWKMMRQGDCMGDEPPIEIPSDASCRAMVLFDPYQSFPLSPVPRVELVEDDKFTETDVSESEDERFVRFEELTEDNDEPVDMEMD